MHGTLINGSASRSVKPKESLKLTGVALLYRSLFAVTFSWLKAGEGRGGGAVVKLT